MNKIINRILLGFIDRINLEKKHSKNTYEVLLYIKIHIYKYETYKVTNKILI